MRIHPLLAYPYVKDAPWPDGSDSRFYPGQFFNSPINIVVTMEELMQANESHIIDWSLR